MIRINFISDLIPNCQNVIDVGSDHAYLAINLLSQKKVQLVVNIEVNKGPHISGVENLKKHQLLDHTINLVNNGFKNLEKQFNNIVFDYAVIAGMGSRTIIDILKENKLKISQFILQTNKNPYLLRKWLINNKYKITKEYIVQEHGIFYPIMIVSKCKFKKLYTNLELNFGKLNNVDDPTKNLAFLKYYLNFLKTHNQNNHYQKEIKLTERMIKKYEGKWNL